VEGPDLNTFSSQIAHPGSKFTCRTICIGESQDTVCGIDASFDAVRNSMGNSSGFSAAGTCNYADRAKQSLSSKPLVVIEFR
jgi:hypothetical protein